MTLTTIAFLDTLFSNDLFASPLKTISDKWLRNLHLMCKYLRVNKISQMQWQQKITEFHNKLPLEDLIKFIDFEKAVKTLKYPGKGIITTDPVLPKVKGISEKYSFTGRIFGMQKDRAIIPHGHKNMTSCHRLLTGEVLLRQYDRIKDEGDFMFVKQTNEEVGKPGSFSCVTEEKNNVHWLITNTSYAHTFDVVVANLNEKDAEVDNIDMYEAEKVETNLLKVKKLYWKDALNKYGDSHH